MKSRSAKQPYTENHGQWKRYKRLITWVSITPVIINAMQIDFHLKLEANPLKYVTAFW